jgi:hypothetical protein
MLCMLRQTPTAIYAADKQSDYTCGPNTAKDNRTILNKPTCQARTIDR